MASELRELGALESQLVDLADAESPRALRYVDLVNSPAPGRPPIVFEAQGQPRAYVFDGREPATPSAVIPWVRRISFRGDAEWVAVLRPGRLDVFRAILDGAAQPKPVEDLPTGPMRFPALIHTAAGRTGVGVRARMLDLLRRSIAQAKAQGVSSGDALSLVGRALFWRFLIDRGLLEGLRFDAVCAGASSWPECMTSKKRALQTFEWLDDTFNGGLLPLATPPSKIPAEAFRSVVGNIAHLADADGQLSLRLPNDWSEVNFAHVPVGLLSEVYEAYMRDEDAARARSQSIFYTPRHIAEFVVEEAFDGAGDLERPRVLDPAAGAGVFLVSAFRALVAREWRRSGTKPSRKVVRRILNRQLTGFDINAGGLRLAELALYLTAIELDPEPRPRPLRLLKFDQLRDRVLFHMPGSSWSGSLAPVEERFRAQFDVVLGNPPWTADAPMAAKQSWTRATRSVVEERLGEQRARTFDFPDTNPDLPFVYRAMEWAKPAASIALVTHGRWLFGQSDRFVRARRDLFESVHVTGVLNGTELRETDVWPNARAPFCLLFAANEKPPTHAAFHFVSPKLDRMPDADQKQIRIDWRDASEIESNDVLARPWLLKARFRGTHFDESALLCLCRRSVPLAEYLDRLGTALKNGYQMGGEAGRQQSSVHMHHLPDLKGAAPGFLVAPSELPRFSRDTLLRPRASSIYKAPLLLVHESMRVGTNAPRAMLSLHDVAFDERFDGASFATVTDGDSVAAYLQLLLQSSLFQFAMLMLDGQYGIEREVVHLQTIKSMPVVPWSELSESLRQRSRELAYSLHHSPESAVFHEIDRFAFDVFNLSKVQRESVEDTLATALPTADGKRNAVRPTTQAEREAFAETCQHELCDVLQASERTARVSLRSDVGLAVWHVVQVDTFPVEGNAPARAAMDPLRFIEAADDASASLVMVRVDATTTLVGVLDRYRYWTRTRARLLAASLLSEIDRG